MSALRKSNLETSTVLRSQAAIGQTRFVYLTQRAESDFYLAQYMGEKTGARVGNYEIVDSGRTPNNLLGRKNSPILENRSQKKKRKP